MVNQPTPSANAFKYAPEFNITCEYIEEFNPTQIATIPQVICQNSSNHTLDKIGVFLYASTKKIHNWSSLSSDINMYRTKFK